MRQFLPILLLLIPLLPECLLAQEIVSVTPSTVTVGSTVTVTGGPFGPEVRVMVGDREIVPSRPGTGDRKLVFTVPPLESGDYALMITADGKVTPSPFSLRVVEPEPRITALSPANIDECSSAIERRVTVSGEFFRPGARLMLDGAAVPVDNIGASEIIFTPPPLTGGLHHIQVVNPGDRKSLAFALFVNSIPEIYSVDQGPDEVTSYELTIRGKNFLYNSILVVDGTAVNPALIAGGTEVVVPPTARPGGDTVQYVDCNTIVLTRHPYSRQARRVSLQVVNPGGQQSPIYYLTIP